MTDLVVRGYRPEDRAAVRHICHVTGYMGEPADWYWPDEDTFAQIFCDWWIDNEPESASIVEVDGEPAGYLLGCVDTEAALAQGLPFAGERHPRWPAHLHIDLLPQARGHGAGAALIARWFGQLRTQEVAGCFLETMAENSKAIRFFLHQGFWPLGANHIVPGMVAPTGEELHLQLMVQEL
jgi:GNAT superfamily N-acetyltransferase